MTPEGFLHLLESAALVMGTALMSVSAYFLRDIHVRFRATEEKVAQHDGRLMVLERVQERYR